MVALNDFSQMNANVMRAVRSNAMDLRSFGSARSVMADNANDILKTAPDGLQATANNSRAVLSAGNTPAVKPAAPQMTQQASLSQRMARFGLADNGPKFN